MAVYFFTSRFLGRYTLPSLGHERGELASRAEAAMRSIVSLIAARYLEGLSNSRDLLITRYPAISIPVRYFSGRLVNGTRIEI